MKVARPVLRGPRRGNASGLPDNTAADHIAVLDQALAQIPDEHRHGIPILVRADTAGATKAFLAHIVSLRKENLDIEFSVGWRTDRLHDTIRTMPKAAWIPAVDTEGEPVEHADVAELTGLLPTDTLTDYPPGMRIIVRRERPHPGAQLNLLEEADGWRDTAFATTTSKGQLAHLDARHRAHARVEDRIRTGKDTGLGRFPSHRFGINKAWLLAVMIAADLIAWAQTMLLHDAALAKAEPKTLRYRLLHVAARLVHGGRRLRLKIDRTWRWAETLAQAFRRCATLPHPIT